LVGRRIIADTNRIVGALTACGQIALARGDEAWLVRHRWFSDAVNQLFADEVAAPLDG